MKGLQVDPGTLVDLVVEGREANLLADADLPRRSSSSFARTATAARCPSLGAAGQGKVSNAEVGV